MPTEIRKLGGTHWGIWAGSMGFPTASTGRNSNNCPPLRKRNLDPGEKQEGERSLNRKRDIPATRDRSLEEGKAIGEAGQIEGIRTRSGKTWIQFP